MDTRDFSIDTIEEIYDIIEELKKQGTFLDTVSDFWLRGEPDAVMLCTYAANGEMEEYYRKYADSMNLTKEKFQKIVENVRAVDKKYAEKFASAKEEMQNFQTKLKNLAGEISMRTISLNSEEYRKAVEVLEGEDNEKKRKLEALIGVKRGNSQSSAMEEKIREILKYSIGSGNLEDEIDVESTEAGISQKRKLIASVESLKEQFQKGKITQDELISEICDLYHVEDYRSKINYSLAVKKYQPEKKAAIVSDIFSTVLYIVGEDGIDAERIEEIHQSVSARSYIEDETWDMAEKAFRGVVVGVNAAVAAEYYGNVGDVESGTETSRPTWRQSELDAAKDFPDYDAQKSFINGEEVPYGTKGSVRPDYYKDGYSVDIKNYNVESASGRSNLARNIEKQYYQRIENLPEGTKQSVMIDIRGQNVTDADLSALYDDIMKRTDNGVEILFKME